MTTKKHIVDKKRLKPGKISVPHALVKPDTSICLITADPQRTYKDAVADPTFPENLRSRIRVIGVAKLKQRYKSFESRRQLLAEYDTFLADERVVTLLPRLLGKTVYESSKRPLPVNLQGSRSHHTKSALPGSTANQKSSLKAPVPQLIAKEIEKALRSARVHLSPSTTTAIQVGFSNFSTDQLQQNIEAIVEGMQQRFVPQGWRNIRAIHIKGPSTAALPVWLASQLWIEEDDVLEDKEAEEAKALESQKGRKRVHRDGEGQSRPLSKKRTKLLGTEDGFSKEMAERREALRQQKRQARQELENNEDVATKALEAASQVNGKSKAPGSKVKSKKAKSALVTAEA